MTEREREREREADFARKLAWYAEYWRAKPWWYRVYSRVYHGVVLFQYRFTGWLPRWIRGDDPHA